MLETADAPALRPTMPAPAAVRNEAPGRWRSLDLDELWKYRELLGFLAWRDIKVRYKQTAVGVAWALLQPVLTMVVFSVVFGHLAHLPSEGVPYPVFAFAALVPWTFFANALTAGANSVVLTPDLVTKVAFPKVIMPAAAVFGCGLDFCLSFVVLLGMMAYYGVFAGIQVLLVVPLLLITLMTALGVTFWLSALNVAYRDVRQALPFVVQIWLFATPVVYPSSLVGQPWRTVLGLNPMAGVVEGFRWSLLGVHPAPNLMLLASTAVAVVLLAAGYLYFRRAEDTFADVI